MLSNKPPERKDRVAYSHGGAIIYIKDHIHYVRHVYLEPTGVECFWIELTLRHKHILFGLFHRPPNSDALYFSTIEDSKHLAVDTGIQDIIVTSDFDYNMLSTQSSIKCVCEQYSFTESIKTPTHFTEHSSSLIDIILTNNENHLLYSEVGDTFLKSRSSLPLSPLWHSTLLNLNVNHISVIPCHTTEVIITFLEKKAAKTNRESIYDQEIHKHVKNITEHITDISKACISKRLTRFDLMNLLG